MTEALEDERLLPWESEKAPTGVGICLSGGGIRAACFALGAIQALQAKRGLLFGPSAASNLSVVSGGSYTGGAFTLNAASFAASKAPADQPAPLAEGSAESKHILANSRYLFAGGPLAVAGRFLLPGAFNFVAFIVLFAWVGTMVATYAWLPELIGANVGSPSGAALWAAAAGALLGGALILRGIYIDGGWRRTFLPLAGVALLFGFGSALIAAMEEIAPLSEPSWWLSLQVVGGAFGFALVLAGLWLASSRIHAIRRPGTRGVLRVALIAVRVLGLALLSLAATGAFRLLDEGLSGESPWVLGAYFGVLFGGIIFGPVSGRVSLHRPYRDQLASCFAVQRDGEGVALVGPLATPLSALRPEPESLHRFPRLLVSATANVRFRDSTGRTRTFAPFVLSHDRCGIPGVAGASFATADLEAGRTKLGIFATTSEPIMSLMTAVATTGAAASPGMGRMTISAVRPVFAIANVRLGRWLPNPLSARAHKRVAEAAGQWQISKPIALGSGYDEFVPELLGLQRADNPRIYVSDGGHYDNLGLLTLLRARCRTIWCVDSEADRDGVAGQLRDVIELAHSELAIEIEIDADVFAGTGGVLGASHAIGRIDYGEGEIGTLIVVKLGLTEGSPPHLSDYQRTDRRFPFHSTFFYPAFARERAESYRALGYANTVAALADDGSAVGG